tara:strand:- start:1200 stop:4481 length:3282 start_codon:yes stop_codon:yes gene_type:complete
MALITFANKVDSQVTGVQEINKITASNINELKAGVNANEVAVIAASKKTQSFLSDFGAKPDLKYIDIEFVSGTEITCPLDSFVSTDVGKHIAIKNTHHNPNTADGTEFPNSSLGRIITVTTKILSVTDGVATIDFSCSLTANARAYSYTNNFDALQDAVNHVQTNKIETILRDGEGIYGINPLYSDKYPNQTAVICENTFKLKIVGDNTNPFKFCVEDSITEVDVIQLKQGNSDFTWDGKILPPDRYSLTFPLIWSVVNTNWNNQFAGNSVRTITIKNIIVTEISDTDGNDSWFVHIYQNTRGGLNNTNKKQIVYLENIDVRFRFGGFSSFSQNGNFNTLYHKNINTQRWSSNGVGELGRAAYDNSTLANMNDENAQWTFENDFTVASGVLTIDDLTSDFNFNDQQSAVLISNSRTFVIEIAGVQYTSSSVASPKSINVTGVADGSYTGTWKLIASSDSYGHPVYYHPNQDMYFDGFKQLHNLMWINTSGGVPNLTNNKVELNLCDINDFRFDGANFKPDVKVISSNVFILFDNINSISTKDSEIELIGNVNYLTSLGGNNFKGSNSHLSPDLIIKESTDLNSFNDVLGFTGLHFEKESHVVFDNWSIPEQGIGRVGFDDENSSVVYKNCKPTTAFPFYSIGRFSNFTSHYIDNKIVNELGRVVDQTLEPFNPSVLTDKVFFENSNFSFKSNRYSPLDPSIPNLLTSAPFNKINVSDFYKQNSFDNSLNSVKLKYETNSYGFSKFIFNIDIGFDFSSTNYYKISNQSAQEYIPRGLAISLLNTININSFSRGVGKGCLSHNSLFEGFVYIEITNSNQLNVLNSKLEYFGNRDVTNNNILVKTINRIVGEVIKFEILPNGFLKEVSSSNKDRFYVSSIPTRVGINNEKVYLDSDISYLYKVNTDVLTDSVYTTTFTEEIPYIHTLNSADPYYNELAYVISTSKVFTVGQNFSTGEIKPFSFKLILDDNSELNFYNTGLNNDPLEPESELPELSRSTWMYRAVQGTNVYAAFVDNLSGKIFILKNHTITLAATNNLEITGLEVLSESWSRNYEGVGIETLTTIQRNAILTECSEGYEVYDTDLSTRFIKIGSSWV